jgi:hypothetical protein
MVTCRPSSATAGISVAAVAPEPITTILLALVVEVIRPGLRMDDLALEVGHPRPFGRVALPMPVIALAHPEEVGGE